MHQNDPSLHPLALFASFSSQGFISRCAAHLWSVRKGTTWSTWNAKWPDWPFKSSAATTSSRPSLIRPPTSLGLSLIINLSKCSTVTLILVALFWFPHSLTKNTNIVILTFYRSNFAVDCNLMHGNWRLKKILYLFLVSKETKETHSRNKKVLFTWSSAYRRVLHMLRIQCQASQQISFTRMPQFKGS
jgi:hypothetical protein